jgi:hypothetical protein
VPSNFAALAAQMRGWTTNLLTLAILLVAGSTVGWQIRQWLREESPAPPVAEENGIPQELRLLSHGGPLQIDRATGDASAARDVLRRRCRAAAAQADPHGAAGPGEARFVARLAEQPPREQSGELALFEPAGQPVMTVVVHRERQRIVAWGFAFVGEANDWSCYTFSPGAATAKLPAAPASSGAAP